MPIIIPLPVATRCVVTVEGAVWKFVSCKSCQQDYAYLLQLEGIGVDHDLLVLDVEDSKKRAQARAQENLSKQCQNVVLPIPCPNCGHYQDDMVSILKEEGVSNRFFAVGLAVAALSLVPLAFGIPYLWIITAAGMFTGLLLMGYAEVATSRFDPNAGDPTPRKLRGQRYAVWGEVLVNLRATLKGDEASEAGESSS